MEIFLLFTDFLSAKFFTNFNDGLGMWSNVKNYKDPLDWQRGRGRTSTYSGPFGDHTDGNGKYFYVPNFIHPY